MTRKLTKKQISDGKSFLDKTAIDITIEYLRTQKPQGFGDSMKIARIAYKQALALLFVREKNLISLADEANLLEKEG